MKDERLAISYCSIADIRGEETRYKLHSYSLYFYDLIIVYMFYIELVPQRTRQSDRRRVWKHAGKSVRVQADFFRLQFANDSIAKKYKMNL